MLRRTLAFKKRLAEGGVAIGAWLSLTDPAPPRSWAAPASTI